MEESIRRFARTVNATPEEWRRGRLYPSMCIRPHVIVQTTTDSITLPLDHYRRRFLRNAALLGAAAMARPLSTDRFPAPDLAADICASPGPQLRKLMIPGESGYLGQLAPRGMPVTLTARPRKDLRSGTGTLEYTASHRGRLYSNPTLVVERGERVRVRLANQLPESTIVHWHGLSVSAGNDGNGSVLAAPGEVYDYDFEIRNRSAMYWYHPHPHGRSAGQTYQGLFGTVLVEDDAERSLRAALDLIPGRTEIPLIMQDRRPGDSYLPSPLDLARGLIGDELCINGVRDAYLDVATRVYRLRLLNAANARTFRIAFRTTGGSLAPFTLIGNDGGLLSAPKRCEQVFLSTAERVDVLIDLRDANVGDVLRMDTLAFDPMYAKVAEVAAGDHAGMGATGASESGSMHEYPHRWPEGSPRTLLELRVRKRVGYDRVIPASLSVMPPIDVGAASERSFRLGFAKGRWRINDRVFEMDAAPIEVQRNTVESWLIRNYHTSMPHAMHLHGFPFEVLGRETSPDEIVTLQQDPQGRLATDFGRKDTVLVWPGESVRIAVDFTMPFPGPQSYLFHCHNLEHEDGGMMLPVLVA